MKQEIQLEMFQCNGGDRNMASFLVVFLEHNLLQKKSRKGSEAGDGSQKRIAFFEQDQEKLYNLVQDKSTTGKQGLGIKGSKKIGGCDWKGKKTSFSDSESDDSADCKSSAKRNHSEVLYKEMNGAPKLKLKTLCKQILCQVSDKSIKLKQLKVLVEEHSPSLFSSFSSKREAPSHLKQKAKESDGPQTQDTSCSGCPSSSAIRGEQEDYSSSQLLCLIQIVKGDLQL